MNVNFEIGEQDQLATDSWHVAEGVSASRNARIFRLPPCTGKLGEWLQGVGGNGEPILYAATTTASPFVTLAKAEPWSQFAVRHAGNIDRPISKSRRAVEVLINWCGLGGLPPIRVTISNSPPVAKGCGSSSVDMSFPMLAACEVIGIKATWVELFRLMCTVERSDYLFETDRLVRVNPVSGEVKVIGPAPRTVLIGWDTNHEGGIQTSVVAHLDQMRKKHQAEYEELVEHLESGGVDDVYHAATRSAELNNELLPKPGFEWARKLAGEFGVGLLAAHTGTYLAFCVAVERLDQEKVARLQWEILEHGFEPQFFQTGTEVT